VYRGYRFSRLINLGYQGQPSPDGNGSYLNFGAPEITSTGAILFPATFQNTIAGADDNSAIILSDGNESIVVARKGQVRSGLSILSLSIQTGNDNGGQTGLNDYGQVAYQATLTGA